VKAEKAVGQQAPFIPRLMTGGFLDLFM